MSEVVIAVKTPNGIHKAVNRLAKKINASENLLPTYGSSADFAHPHIEVNSQGLHWVVIERGMETQRKTTNDPHELLYWIFEAVTSEMAMEFELKNRIESQDFRRIYFQKQEELLGELDSSWKKTKVQHHEAVLRKYPYDDNVLLRLEFYKELKARGHSPEEADRIADEKYPRPLVPGAESYR